MQDDDVGIILGYENAVERYRQALLRTCLTFWFEWSTWLAAAINGFGRVRFRGHKADIVCDSASMQAWQVFE